MVKTRRTLKKGGQSFMGQDQGMTGYPSQQRSWTSNLNPANWFSSSQNQGTGSGLSLGGKKKRGGGFMANTQGSLASSAAPVSGMNSPKASYVGGRRTRRRKGRKSRKH